MNFLNGLGVGEMPQRYRRSLRNDIALVSADKADRNVPGGYLDGLPAHVLYQLVGIQLTVMSFHAGQ